MSFTLLTPCHSSANFVQSIALSSFHLLAQVLSSCPMASTKRKAAPAKKADAKQPKALTALADFLKAPPKKEAASASSKKPPPPAAPEDTVPTASSKKAPPPASSKKTPSPQPSALLRKRHRSPAPSSLSAQDDSSDAESLKVTSLASIESNSGDTSYLQLDLNNPKSLAHKLMIANDAAIQAALQVTSLQRDNDRLKSLLNSSKSQISQDAALVQLLRSDYQSLRSDAESKAQLLTAAQAQIVDLQSKIDAAKPTVSQLAANLQLQAQNAAHSNVPIQARHLTPDSHKKKKDVIAIEESDSDSDDVPQLCEELRHKKTLKHEMHQIFVYERSYIYGKSGMGWGLGPDLDQRVKHRTFLSDPIDALHNSSLETELRPRIVAMKQEPLFAEAFKLIQVAAQDQCKLLLDPKHKLTKILDFEDSSIKEVLAELTAVYIHADVAKSKCRAQRRSITDTVSLLRESQAAILAMSIQELKAYRGRSFVSHLLEHSTTTYTVAHSPSPAAAAQVVAREESFLTKRQRADDNRALQRTARLAALNVAPKGSPPVVPPHNAKVKYVLKSSCLNLVCSNCRGQGHLADKCASAVPPDATKRCFCCQGIGHMSLSCTSDKYIKI